MAFDLEKLKKNKWVAAALVALAAGGAVIAGVDPVELVGKVVEFFGAGQ